MTLDIKQYRTKKKVDLDGAAAERIEKAIRKVEARSKAIGPTYRRRTRVPQRAAGSEIHWALCYSNAGTGNTISAWLDDANGPLITVICTIAKGSNLNLAFPRLTAGLEIPIIQKGDQWKCLWGFAAAQEDC